LTGLETYSINKMAAFLDVGLLEYFSIIFPALLIFVVVYALFEKLKIVGESKSVHAIIAIAFAFILMLSKDVMDIINFISPWFVLLFIFIILLLVAYKTLGASDENIANFIRTDKLTQWIIIIIGVIILFSALSHVYGERLLPITEGGTVSGENNMTSVTGSATPTYSARMGETFFHPKVLGFVLIMTIAVFTVGLLTKDSI